LVLKVSGEVPGILGSIKKGEYNKQARIDLKKIEQERFKQNTKPKTGFGFSETQNLNPGLNFWTDAEAGSGTCVRACECTSACVCLCD